jgi:hypothetical protein
MIESDVTGYFVLAATGDSSLGGDDMVTGGSDRDYIFGGKAEDHLDGAGGNDFIIGDFGQAARDNDQLSFMTTDYDSSDGGGDVIIAGEGYNILFGGDGGDTLYGDNIENIIFAGWGRTLVSLEENIDGEQDTLISVVNLLANSSQDWVYAQSQRYQNGAGDTGSVVISSEDDQVFFQQRAGDIAAIDDRAEGMGIGFGSAGDKPESFNSHAAEEQISCDRGEIAAINSSGSLVCTKVLPQPVDGDTIEQPQPEVELNNEPAQPEQNDNKQAAMGIVSPDVVWSQMGYINSATTVAANDEAALLEVVGASMLGAGLAWNSANKTVSAASNNKKTFNRTGLKTLAGKVSIQRFKPW